MNDKETQRHGDTYEERERVEGKETKKQIDNEIEI
jgi:hypothetical protein